MKLRIQIVLGCLVGIVAANASAQTVDLASPNARQIVSGSAAGGRAGTWVAVGDVNGDINNKDLFIGAPAANSNRGEVRVLFGWLAQSTGDFSLDLADVVLTGGAAEDRFGASVDAGFITQRETVPATNSRDLIVGAPGALSGRGEIYVFPGPLTGGSALTTANAILRIRGAAGDQLGVAVESADLNNDGFREIIAGAPGTGRVYVIDYHSAPASIIDLATQSARMTISGPGIGNALTVGDITGDGVFDLAMGAPTAAEGAGAVFVVNGRASGALPSVVTLPAGANEVFTGLGLGDHAGTSVWIKDFDGDGTWDLAVGAPDADGPNNTRVDAGDAYVFFGRVGLPANLAPDTTIYGGAAGFHTGTWIRSGDITRDEPDDLALLTSGANGGMGVVYIVYGRPRDQFPAVIDLANQADRLIVGDETVGAIQSIAVWEVTGEGAEDIAIGVPGADGGAGRIYLSISPRMSVAPDPLYIAGVQGSTSSITVTVGNGGGVSITWSATAQTSWLGASPGSGSAAITAPGTFTLSAALAGIAPGVYSGSIDVNSTSKHLAHLSTLPVTVAVLSQPTISADHAFPLAWGERITWTAQASAPGSTLLYEFYRFDSAVGWRKVQAFSPSNTYSWTPAAQDAGDHFIQVWVKTTQSSATYDAYVGSSSFTITRPLPTITSFTNDGIYPMAPNTPVQLAATATRGSGPLQYRFYVYREGAGWSILQDYSASNTATWTPTLTGNYALQVWVRSSGISDPYEAWAGTDMLRVTNTEPVRAISLTPDRAFPAHAGQPITFTATASGGSAGPLQFQFMRYDEGSGWSTAQAYSSQRTYTWTPGADAAGTHALQVWIRSAGVSAQYEAWLGTNYFSVVVDPLTSPALSADAVFPVPANTPIHWTASVSGGVAPLEYKFWVLKSGGAWTMARDYSPSNTFTWTPTSDGSYALQVWVRNAGSTTSYDTWVGTPFFTIGASSAARVVSVTANKPLPAPSGSTIVWTAVASGGTAGPLQYKFWCYNQNTGLWTLIQDYSSTNTYAWTPAPSEAGTYVIQAWVRSAGSSATYEGWASTNSFIVK